MEKINEQSVGQAHEQGQSQGVAAVATGSAPLIKLLDSIQVELRLRGLGHAGDVIALAVITIERQRDALNAAHRFWYGSTGEGEPGRTHSQYRMAAAEVRMKIESALDLPNAGREPARSCAAKQQDGQS